MHFLNQRLRKTGRVLTARCAKIFLPRHSQSILILRLIHRARALFLDLFFLLRLSCVIRPVNTHGATGAVRSAQQGLLAGPVIPSRSASSAARITAVGLPVRPVIPNALRRERRPFAPFFLSFGPIAWISSRLSGRTAGARAPTFRGFRLAAAA